MYSKINKAAAAIGFLTMMFFQSGCSSSQNVTTTKEPTATVTYQQFYDDLSPYGRWVDYPGYGYVWSPDIDGFQPYYTDGYWMNTTGGWYWNSGYPWGWAPFHYGRWFYETGYGWMWLPGYEWAPAWVAWRNSTDFYGWAPLGPGMRVGVSVGVQIPFEHWTFINHRHLADRSFQGYTVDRSRNETIYNNTTIINNFNRTINNTAYARGPQVREVEKYSGQKIPQYTVRPREVPNQTTEAPVRSITLPEESAIKTGLSPVRHSTVIDNNNKEIKTFRPQVRAPQSSEKFMPRNPVRYQDLPHDNGRRGTWAIPEPRPVERVAPPVTVPQRKAKP